MSDSVDATLAPGTRVGGRFVLERLLRRGALCEVYLARSEGGGTARYELRRTLVPAAPGLELAVRRELDRVASAGSRAIPSLQAVETDPAGLLVVTEAPEALAPRDTLRELIRRDLRIAAPDALKILREVARALDAIHALVPQVVHRAVHPENVLLMDRRRKVWLTECGLAHALIAAGVVPSKSAVVESAYSSPDDLLNRATTRGDLFSLASVAYEMFTGKQAFQGATNAAIESALLRGARPKVDDALGPRGAEVDAVLAMAWSSDAQSGFVRASELVAALERALESKDPPSVPTQRQGGPLSRTMIGMGGPGLRGSAGAPRASVPRGGPSMEPRAEREGGLRVLPPTQKVQVPQLHPPGTESLAPSSEPEVGERVTVGARALDPSSTGVSPPELDVTKPVRIDPPQEARGDIFPATPSSVPEDAGPAARAASEGAAPLAAREVAGSEDPSSEARTLAPAAPDSSDDLASEAPTLFPSAVEEADASEEFDFVTEGDIEIESVERAPSSRPGSMPPLPPPRLSTAPPPPPPAALRASVPEVQPEPPSARVSEERVVVRDPDETAPAPPESERPLPSLFDAAEDPPSVPPRVSDIGSLRPPPPSADAAPPVMTQRAPYPELTPAAAESVLAPPELPRRSNALAIGGSLLLLLAAGAAGAWWYLTQQQGPPPVDAPTRVSLPPGAPAVDASAPAALAETGDGSAMATPLPEAGTAATADAAGEADIPTAAEDAASGADDAGTVHAEDALSAADTSDDAGAPSVAAPASDAGSAAVEQDAGSPAAVGGLAAPVIRREPLRGHPRARESRALEDAMYDEVLRCAARSHRRRVRVAVRYLGETGLPDQVHIGAPYNRGEVGQCIEAVIRRHPVGRFTSQNWETYFVFDPDDA